LTWCSDNTHSNLKLPSLSDIFSCCHVLQLTNEKTKGKIKVNHTSFIIPDKAEFVKGKLFGRQGNSTWNVFFYGKHGLCSGKMLASHHCDIGSTPGLCVICEMSLLLILSLASRVFLQVLRFSSLCKRSNRYATHASPYTLYIYVYIVYMYILYIYSKEIYSNNVM
jgi:hypothetical protein